METRVISPRDQNRTDVTLLTALELTALGAASRDGTGRGSGGESTDDRVEAGEHHGRVAERGESRRGGGDDVGRRDGPVRPGIERPEQASGRHGGDEQRPVDHHVPETEAAPQDAIFAPPTVALRWFP